MLCTWYQIIQKIPVAIAFHPPSVLFLVLPVFLLYWIRKLNLLARFLRISPFLVGELGRAEIAFQRLLNTDDEYAVAHVAEVVDVNKFWFSLLFFVSDTVTLQYIAFVTFPCFWSGHYFHGKYLMFFPQIIHFSKFLLIFLTIPFSSSSNT